MRTNGTVRAAGPIQPGVRARGAPIFNDPINHGIGPPPAQPELVAGETSESGVAGKIQSFKGAKRPNHGRAPIGMALSAIQGPSSQTASI